MIPFIRLQLFPGPMQHLYPWPLLLEFQGVNTNKQLEQFTFHNMSRYISILSKIKKKNTLSAASSICQPKHEVVFFVVRPTHWNQRLKHPLFLPSPLQRLWPSVRVRLILHVQLALVCERLYSGVGAVFCLNLLKRFDPSRLVYPAVGCLIPHSFDSGLLQRKRYFLDVNQFSLRDCLINLLSLEQTFGIRSYL